MSSPLLQTPLSALLEEHRAATPASLLLIDSSLTRGEALSKLAESRVLSAPFVLRFSPGESNKYTILAFLSVADFVAAFCAVADSVSIDLPVAERSKAFFTLAREFMAADVISMHTKADGDVMSETLTSESTLADLVRRLLRFPRERPARQVCHRVGIFDTHGHIADVISMSSVVRFARKHCDELGSLSAASLNDLGLTQGEVVSVSSLTPTDKAFATMVARSVSGVGVVDAKTGVLVANLSESDFRGFSAAHFGQLALPVGEFLLRKLGVTEAREAVPEGLTVPAPTEGACGMEPAACVLHAANVVITVDAGDSFGRLLAVMTGAKVHRVYVVKDGLPCAVITLTDVLTVLEKGKK